MHTIINSHIIDCINETIATNLLILLNLFLIIDERSWKHEPINCGNEFKNDIWNVEKPSVMAKTDM